MLKATLWFSTFCFLSVALVDGFETASSNLEAVLDLKNVCLDFKKISSSSVQFPSDAKQYLKALKEKSSVKFYYSESMVSNWNKIKALPVQGLNATVSEIFSFLHNQGCFVFPWGGSVRDLVMGHFIVDIDAEITCDPGILWDACIDKFGAINCRRHRQGDLKMVMGNFGEVKGNMPMVEPIDLAHWNVTFGGRKSALEYTPDSLSFFPDTGLLIDISGKALKDICSGRIRIPARKKYWTQWRGNNTIDKLLRYWTLRSKGFKPANENIRRFIFSELQQNFNGEEAKRFICHKFFDGKLEKNGKCQIFSEDHEEQRNAKLNTFLKTLEMDFGSTNVRTEFKELFDKLEIVFKY